MVRLLHVSKGPLAKSGLRMGGAPRRASLQLLLLAGLIVLQIGKPLRGFAAGAVPLSASARAQIQALLDEKASWTAAQGKLESQLIHALKQDRGQSFAP